MQYKQRFLYALLTSLLFMLGLFFADLKPLLLHIKALRATNQKLSAQLDVLEKIPPQPDGLPLNTHMTTQPSVLERTAEMVALAHSAQLAVQAVNFTKSQADEVAIHFLGQGSFPEVGVFTHLLSEKNTQIITTDFSLAENDHQKLTTALDLVLLASPLQLSEVSNPSPSADPFCHGQNKTLVLEDETAKLQSFPLELIKMVGYIQQAPRQRAFLLLPANEIATVTWGSVLGKEHGVVTELDESHVLVVTSDQKHWLLKIARAS